MNAEQRRAHGRRYYLAHRDVILERAKRWQKAHLKEIYAKRKAQREADKNGSKV